MSLHLITPLDASNNPTLSSMSNWSPVVDVNLINLLSQPEGVAMYLNDLAQMGYICSNLQLTDWQANPNNNDQVCTYTVPNEGGLVTLTGTAPQDGSSNYQYQFSFIGSTSNVTHTTGAILGIAGGGGTLLAGGLLAMAKLFPEVLNNIYENVSGLIGNAVADAAETGAEVAAEAAAEAAGVALAEGLGAVIGPIAAAVALAALIIELLEKSFQVRITFINSSSVDYVLMPNYYVEDGQVIGASDSCAEVTNLLYGEAPTTICTGGDTLYPFLGKVQSYLLDPNNPSMGYGQPQASLYTLVLAEDGLTAPGSLMMLVEAETYTAPTTSGGNGQTTISQGSNAWTGLVVNTHYHDTSDAPNIGFLTCGGNVGNGENWYNQLSSSASGTSGTHAAQKTQFTWALQDGDQFNPQKDPNSGAITWHIMVTISDIDN